MPRNHVKVKYNVKNILFANFICSVHYAGMQTYLSVGLGLGKHSE